jgi:hypothetical protein
VYSALRIASGISSVQLLVAAFGMIGQGSGKWTWTAGGMEFVLPMPWAGLWVSQVSYLLFAASRAFKRRSRGGTLHPVEEAALKPVRPFLLGVACTPLAWLAWCLLFRRG